MVGISQLDNGVLLLTELILEEAQADASGDEAGLATVLEQGRGRAEVQTAPLVAVERIDVLQALRTGEGRVEGQAVLVKLRELGVLLGRGDGAEQEDRQSEQKAVHSKQLIFKRFLAWVTRG